jgi:hypothetical protein
MIWFQIPYTAPRQTFQLQQNTTKNILKLIPCNARTKILANDGTQHITSDYERISANTK